MGRFQMALMRFMAGRYGMDALQKCLLGLYCVLVIVNWFVGSLMLVLLELLLLGWWTFRLMSRNIPARIRENERYLKNTAGIRRFVLLQRRRFRDRKTHVYRICPYCKAVVRLPKVKTGKRWCDCPRCGKEFSVKL